MGESRTVTSGIGGEIGCGHSADKRELPYNIIININIIYGFKACHSVVIYASSHHWRK